VSLAHSLLNDLWHSQLHQLPTTAGPSIANEQDLAHARQFFDTQGPSAGPTFAPHPAELARLDQMPAGSAGPNHHDAWVMEHQKPQAFRPEESQHAGWTTEFGANQVVSPMIPGVQQNMTVRPECTLHTTLHRPLHLTISYV
jgi:peroxin-5